MRIGFTLPQFAPLTRQPDQVARFAEAIEEQVGADSLWVGGRLLAPVEPTVGYGGGDTIPAEFNAILDPFALLTVAATVTSRVPMTERGARLDECLDALEALWTHDPAEYQGRYWSVPATRAELKPAQKPGPPIYLAGFAPAAQRRVARRADGWLPGHRPGAGPFDPTETVTNPLAHLRRLAAEEGRDPKTLRTVLRVYPVAGATVEDCVDTLRRAEQETETDHAFVDLQCVAENVDHALSLAHRIVDGARRS